jgi:hypothetical protein
MFTVKQAVEHGEQRVIAAYNDLLTEVVLRIRHPRTCAQQESWCHRERFCGKALIMKHGEFVLSRAMSQVNYYTHANVHFDEKKKHHLCLYMHNTDAADIRAE